MRKREAELTTHIRKYLTHTRLGLGSCAIEIKVTPGTSIPFNAVQPHQLQALKNAENVLVWKIADDSRGVKPFDMFILEGARAFVALSFIKPRASRVVYLVPVQVWIHLSENSGRKSVTEAMLQSPDLILSGVMRLVLPTMSQGRAVS